ncbi:rCG44224 [Rattus norvegicus]|uniref:RCG44224 n=1 Tax=Rattus norvegicus TaxID=10116 RepID=A6J7F8_RAT|nr:rCG44224 [Rattus norvegicus]
MVTPIPEGFLLISSPPCPLGNCAHECGVCGSQKKVSAPLELEMQVVVTHLM